ncbi:crinkler family protein [Gigaspora margarita]|uniref:Crinkler family protein n=1 Tax=Gigaspora margarita TaxID=4874 RepID=A0A8H4AVU2_GIGMA|nr:crinkler family protein [Gigaspora margarita]
MTNNLSNLKDIIKVQLPPEYSDVNVHHFKLWKVNIHDDQEDELSNITLRDSDILLATRKIRYYFPNDPVEDYIHIIDEAKNSLKLEVMELKDQVKALQKQIASEKSSSSNDFQHQTNPIIARNENINQILNIPSPSIAAQHSIFFTKVNKNELHPIILNHCPHNSLGLPVILFNNIFNKFIIDLENENLPISPKVSSMLNSLIKDISNYYKLKKNVSKCC